MTGGSSRDCRRGRGIRRPSKDTYLKKPSIAAESVTRANELGDDPGPDISRSAHCETNQAPHNQPASAQPIRRVRDDAEGGEPTEEGCAGRLRVGLRADEAPRDRSSGRSRTALLGWIDAHAKAPLTRPHRTTLATPRSRASDGSRSTLRHRTTPAAPRSRTERRQPLHASAPS